MIGRMRELETKIDEIHQALVGDDYRKGIVQRLDKLENESRFHKIFIGAGTFISLALGWIFKNN